MKREIDKLFIVFFLFVTVIFTVLFLDVFFGNMSIEELIAKELGVSVNEIDIFSEYECESLEIIGFHSELDKLGFALITNSNNDINLLRVRCTDNLLERASNIWVHTFAYDTRTYYIFLSSNMELSKVELNEFDKKYIYSIYNNPSITVISLDGESKKVSYYFYDKSNKSIQ